MASPVHNPPTYSRHIVIPPSSAGSAALSTRNRSFVRTGQDQLESSACKAGAARKLNPTSASTPLATRRPAGSCPSPRRLRASR
jgi:hypothetical protein